MTRNEAEKAGVAAQQAGMGRAPALNGSFLKAASAAGNLIASMDAYLHGWDVASLAANAIAGSPSIAELQRIAAA